MNVKDQIMEDIKTSMKAGDKNLTSILRMVLSDIKYAQSAVNIHAELSQEDQIKTVKGYQKKLIKSTEEYPDDSPQKQKILEEIKVVERYLPKGASDQEVAKVVDEILAAHEGPREFGLLMKKVMERFQGQADGKQVSTLLKQKI